MLCDMKRSNPKGFFGHFRKKKHKIPSSISMQDHFRYMSENCETNVNHDTGTDMCDDDTYEELDFPITIDEIDRCINKLKRGITW